MSGEKPSANASVFHASSEMELDLRGQRAEDALDALDRYLDSTVMAGLPFVRITHGKGTGKLRQAIREALQDWCKLRQLLVGGACRHNFGLSFLYL